MGAALTTPYSKTVYIWRSLHNQELVTEHLRVLSCSVQIAPSVGGVAVGQVAEAVPEVASVGRSLGLGRDRHLRALRSDLLRLLLLELLTNGHALGSCGFVSHGVGAIRTEELTGVISENVRIGQDGLVGAVLVRQLLEELTSLDQLLIGLDQRILNITGILVDDRSGIRAEVIDNFKTCLGYSVCPEHFRGYFQRSLGRVVGVTLVVVDSRRRGLRRQAVELGRLLGTVAGRVDCLGLTR